jgi:hypothetical protein
LDVQLATRVLERIAEQDAGGDPQRDHAGGKDEQHRNEDELRRDRRAAPDLEIKAKRDRVGHEQQRDRGHRRRAVRGQQRSQQAGDGEEEPQGDGDRRAIASGQTAEPPAPLLLDYALSIGINARRQLRGEHDDLEAQRRSEGHLRQRALLHSLEAR